MPLVSLESLQQLAAINLNSDPGAIGGPVVIPEAVQVHIIWGLPAGKVGRNVLHARVSPGFTPTVAIADAIRAGLSTGAAYTALQPFLITQVGITRVDLRDIRAAGNPFVTGTTVTGTGSSTGTQLPIEVAIVLTERTARSGPQNRGRIYTCGWASNAVAAGNVIDATLATALGTWGGTILTVLSGQSMQLAIGQPARAAYTGSTGTAHPARGARLENVTQVVLRNNTFDTQRRRGLK